jgi:hypothetical protein
MENEEGLYEGVGSGGRATQKVLRQFREGMAADHRQLIDGGREMPDPTILDSKIQRLRTLSEPFADMIFADQLPTPEQTSLHGSMVKQLDVVGGTRAEAITLRAQMTAAADAGLMWWRTKGGPAIHNIIARYAGEDNRMIQLRKVVQCVREHLRDSRTFGRGEQDGISFCHRIALIEVFSGRNLGNHSEAVVLEAFEMALTNPTLQARNILALLLCTAARCCMMI